MNFCDEHDPQVQEIARDLRFGSYDEEAKRECTKCTDEEFTIAAFNFVRDEIKYTVLYNWTVPVSTTLATRAGNCGTKACLLVAILRAGGLSAEFTVERIDTANMFFMVPRFVTGRCNNARSIHFAATVKLQDRWIRVDPTVDRDFGMGVSGAVGNYLQVTFDGKSNAVPGSGKCEGEHKKLLSFHFVSSTQLDVKKEIRCQLQRWSPC